jgi:hypothetical protein
VPVVVADIVRRSKVQQIFADARDSYRKCVMVMPGLAAVYGQGIHRSCRPTRYCEATQALAAGRDGWDRTYHVGAAEAGRQAFNER